MKKIGIADMAYSKRGFVMMEINQNKWIIRVSSGRMYRFYCRHPLWCLIFVLSILSFFVYKDFILFHKLYIYAESDIGSDLHNQTLPMVGYMADYIRSFGYPWWTFNLGLGQNVYAYMSSFGDPFISIAILLGKSALPYSLGYLQAAKPVVAGLFFYLFLKKAKINGNISFIVATLYAFCGHMIGRGAWVSYPNEVVWAAFVLYAIERCLVDFDFRMLPLAVAVFFLSQKGFQSTLYTAYFFIYVLIRYLSIHTFRRRDFTKFIFKYIGFFALGAALAAVIFLPNILFQLSSARISNYNSVSESLKTVSPFSFMNFKEFFTTFYRWISIDALGTGNNYTGIINYLEDPLFYCGTISMVLLPQAFFIKERRKRNAILVMLAMAACYIIFPYVRFIANGFLRDTYKLSSFIIIIIVLYSCAVIFENMIYKRNIHLLVLFITFTAIGGIGAAGVFIDRMEPSLVNFDFDPVILLLCGLFILAGFLLLILYKRSAIARRTVLLLLAAVVCVEAGIFSYHTVNVDRIFLSNDFETGKITYNDSTNEAVAFLNQRENNAFYRMETDEKKYDASILDASLYQKYYGVKSYTLQTQYNLDFFGFVNAGLVVNPSNYVYPFNTRYALYSLLGVKYMLSKSESPEFPGYKSIGKIEDHYIFENDNAFSLGTGYDQYVYVSEIGNAGNVVRDLTLLHAVALEDGTPVPKGLSHFDVRTLENQKTSLQVSFNNLATQGIQILSFDNNQLTFESTGDGAHYIDIPISAETAESPSSTEASYKMSSSQETYGWVDWIKNGEITETYLVNLNKGEAAYDFSGPSIDTLRINFASAGVYTINGFVVETLPQSLYEQAAEDKKEDRMNITSFSQNRITGEIESTDSKILFLSIPFDKGWSAKVDGIKTDILLADRGLMGIAVDKGKHSIELSYVPPYLYAGSIISICAVLIYLIILLKYRRLQKSDCTKDV